MSVLRASTLAVAGFLLVGQDERPHASGMCHPPVETPLDVGAAPLLPTLQNYCPNSASPSTLFLNPAVYVLLSGIQLKRDNLPGLCAYFQALRSIMNKIKHQFAPDCAIFFVHHLNGFWGMMPNLQRFDLMRVIHTPPRDWYTQKQSCQIIQRGFVRG